jgi:hypothetical protein
VSYASPIQTSVNSGELSPRMVARVDFDRYKNGCARARNIVLLPTGGFTKAPGTRYIGASYDQTKVGRLLPFKFSQSDAYIIEMSENVARFYRRQAIITCPDVGAAIRGGDFNVTGDISYWDQTGTGQFVYDETGEQLQLGDGNDEQYSSTEQQVTTSTTGVEHVIAFQIIGAVGAKVKVVVGSTPDSDDLFEETELGTGWHTVSFTPSTSPFYFGVRNYTDETIYLDNVSVLDNTALILGHDYSEAELQDIRVVQSNDVLYVFHPDKQTRKFERRATRTWSLVDVAWDDGPYNDSNEGFDFSLTQLVDNPDFEDGITPWQNVSPTGTAIIGNVEWDAAQKIVILTPGNSPTEYGAVEQEVDTGANGSNVFVLHFQFLGATNGGADTELLIGTTSGGANIHAATGYEQGWHSIKITSSAATWFIRVRHSATGDDRSAGALGGCFLYRQNSRLLELSGTEGDVTCTAYGHTPFASTDVGRLLRLTWPGKEPAWGIITAFTSTSVVSLRLRRKAPYASIPTEDWQFGAWSETRGYPAVATFFQSRLVAANTALDPQTLWFSQSSDLENMRPDSFNDAVSVTEDDDALTYLIAAEEVNAVTWMAGKRKLLIGTAGGQLVASSQGAAITATDISIEPHSDVPCKLAPPVSTQSAILFIEESGTQVHDLGFSFDEDSFISADMSILADHILKKQKAVEIVLQKRPLQTIWTRREDGRLAILAYNRRQDIIGWSHRIMGGSFSTGAPVVESIAVIPGSDDNTQVLPSGERDEVWVMVKRTINGGTKRYIEVFEEYYEGVVREEYDTEALWEAAVKADMVQALYVDSAVTYDGSATATITGLNHLEGQTVKVLADGKVHSSEVVASGQITLDYEASYVQVGLGYEWEFESLKLPFGTQAGSGVGKIKGIPAVGLCLHDAGLFSYGLATYDEEEGRVLHDLTEIDFLRDGLDFDEAIPLFTGELIRNLDGTSRRDVRVYMTGDNPLPFTMLAMTPQILSQEK